MNLSQVSWCTAGAQELEPRPIWARSSWFWCLPSPSTLDPLPFQPTTFSVPLETPRLASKYLPSEWMSLWMLFLLRSNEKRLSLSCKYGWAWGPFEIIDEPDTNLFKLEQKGTEWIIVKCANDLDNKPKQRAWRKAPCSVVHTLCWATEKKWAWVETRQPGGGFAFGREAKHCNTLIPGGCDFSSSKSCFGPQIKGCWIPRW